MKIPNLNNNISTENFSNQLQKVENDEFQRKLKSAMGSKDEKQLKKASQELEAIFMSMMFKEMRNTVVKSDLVESAPGREMWESMLDEKISEESAKGKGFGLADMIYKQLTRDMKNTYKIKE